MNTAIRRDRRQLKDLRSIGPAMLEDFRLLGVGNLETLARSDPHALYARLCELTKSRQDICVLDAFSCAVAQARDPNLPEDQKNWWYWSRLRNARSSADARPNKRSEKRTS